ncbi:class I SAM-dependent methyltransferase [Leptolyngbya sp. FACHB-36]|uniref:class I SAM-dependent methyltransferase n=1 Tax=Leptolyngbya sp. FACHB-36 TaxID=2692808 RepID=UPI0016811BD7|nr:class I SAM-dependent methyltransferase [Leptolyngbya sp. FACHB-36]MBD2021138.1 class I SAM-dependent methyltransferase [Leptolyngbya sp. FACHB-36]
MRILDVGGVPWSSFCSDLTHCEVTYLNVVDSEKIAPRLKPNQRYIQADARDIPIASSQFDLVFSNSVIEHVGDFESQMQVANEVRRVGNAYWIQTPYKHFPIEPHYNFPLCQYFPRSMQHWVYKSWRYSWYKKYSLPYEEIFLLDKRQMQQLFPDAQFYYERVGFLTKSITAIKRFGDY